MIEERLYIVTYDIGDERRWRRVFKLMKGYGRWLQLSVFQCRLSAQRRAELARRRMMHAYNADAEVEAEAAADALLRLYPQSALAYQVKGEIARRQHRLPQAVQLFERAVQLMTSAQDVLFVTESYAQLYGTVERAAEMLLPELVEA